MGIGNNVRALGDANLTVTKALPSAAGTLYSSSIDLSSTSPERVGDFAKLKLDVPTLASVLTGSHTITYTVQDSADNSSFADVSTKILGPYIYTGSDNAAVATSWPIPDTVRRYVRLKIVAGASAEDCSGVTATFQVVV